jgi:hypothetical protein
MPCVAKCIYFRPKKIFHQYQVLINKKEGFFSRVYATLEEAIKGRDDFLASLEDKLARGLREDK